MRTLRRAALVWPARAGLLGRTAAATLVAASTLLAACGPSFKATTPPGFVEIDRGWDDYDFRATTADGLVIGVREIEHDPKGEPAFWLQAIQNRMRDRGGYALLETREVQSKNNIKGTQMRFGHDEEGGKPYLYYLTLFVTDDYLHLVEVGGTKEQLEANAANIDGFLRDLEI